MQNVKDTVLSTFQVVTHLILAVPMRSTMTIIPLYWWRTAITRLSKLPTPLTPNRWRTQWTLCRWVHCGLFWSGIWLLPHLLHLWRTPQKGTAMSPSATAVEHSPSVLSRWMSPSMLGSLLDTSTLLPSLSFWGSLIWSHMSCYGLPFHCPYDWTAIVLFCLSLAS